MTPHRQWVIDLPYKKISRTGPQGVGVVHPVPPLTMNSRMNHNAERRLKRELRKDAAVLARVAKLPTGLHGVEVTLRWVPRVRRPRDTDNPMPTLKPLIDGLVDYGLVADDDRDHVRSQVYIGKPNARTPSLQLVITEVPPDALVAVTDPLAPRAGAGQAIPQ